MGCDFKESETLVIESDTTVTSGGEFDDLDTPVTLSDETLEEVLHSIPSPLEFSDQLKDKEAELNESLIAVAKKNDYFITEADKAIAMGVYGTDLSYINIFKETLKAAKYYSIVVDLSENLNVSQFFNLQTVRDLEENENDKEKVLGIIRSGYREIHKYLETHEKNEISLLMLYGSWVESMYITLNIHDTNHIDLSKMIGNQKITVNKLIAIFTHYNDIPKVNTVIELLEQMKEVYEGISITYEYKETLATQSEDKSLDLIHDQIKTIKITENQILEIKKVLVQQRNMFFE